MAKAFPLGNVSMVAFIAVFRLACPWIGLGGGTACGYVAALATLLAVEWIARRMGGAGSLVLSVRIREEDERYSSCPTSSCGVIPGGNRGDDIGTDKVLRLRRRSKTTSAITRSTVRQDGVVPLGQHLTALEPYPCPFFGTDFALLRIFPGVQAGLAVEPLLRARPSDVLEHDFVARQRLSFSSCC